MTISVDWDIKLQNKQQTNSNFFSKNSFSEYHQCQTARNQIRPNKMSGLIWVQTVCKGYLSEYDTSKQSAQQCIYVSVHRLVTVCNDPYEAAKDSYAVVVCTEWDEFKVS